MLEQKDKLYVGNLEYSITEDDLKTAFEGKGIKTKIVEIIKDKYTGRSKGFGFVSVETEEEAQKAIDSLNGQDLKGRSLRINKAKKPKTDFDRNR